MFSHASLSSSFTQEFGFPLASSNPTHRCLTALSTGRRCPLVPPPQLRLIPPLGTVLRATPPHSPLQPSRNHTRHHIPPPPDLGRAAFRPGRPGPHFCHDHLHPRPMDHLEVKSLHSQIPPSDPGVGILHAVEPLEWAWSEQRVNVSGSV